MRRKSTAKKVQVKSCLTVADWVTFLSNERHGMASNVVNFSVFLVAAIALILVASAHIAFAIISAIVVFGSAGWVYFGVIGPIRQRGYLADEILKGIISGELKDVDSIRGEWALGLAVIRRGWFLRQARARLAVLKRTWRYEWKPTLVAFKETWQRKWETALAAVRERWYQEKARLVALKETSQRRWETGLAVLRQTWCQERARMAALGHTWHLW